MRHAIAFAMVDSVVGAAWSGAAQASCYVAIIHGAGPNDTGATDININTNTTMVRGTANSYWWPENQPSTYSFVQSVGRVGASWHIPDAHGHALAHCTTRLIRYDAAHGGRGWWDTLPEVAAELTSFIGEFNIQNNELIVVTHSMGGLIARFIANSGTQGSAWTPGYGGDYTDLTDKIRYIITVQAPHMGAKGADDLAGTSGDTLAETLSDIIEAFGFRSQTAQSDSMRESVMEAASGNQNGWMGDALRAQHIWVISGLTTGIESRQDNCGATSTSDDCLLDKAWGVIHHDGPVLGDGLVEASSAMGFDYLAQETTAGFVKWIDAYSNHNQGRYSIHYGDFYDYTLNNWDGGWTNGQLARYIGTYVDQLF